MKRLWAALAMFAIASSVFGEVSAAKVPLHGASSPQPKGDGVAKRKAARAPAPVETGEQRTARLLQLLENDISLPAGDLDFLSAQLLARPIPHSVSEKALRSQLLQVTVGKKAIGQPELELFRVLTERLNEICASDRATLNAVARTFNRVSASRVSDEEKNSALGVLYLQRSWLLERVQKKESWQRSHPGAAAPRTLLCPDVAEVSPDLPMGPLPPLPPQPESDFQKAMRLFPHLKAPPRAARARTVRLPSGEVVEVPRDFHGDPSQVKPVDETKRQLEQAPPSPIVDPSEPPPVSDPSGE